MIRAGSLPAGGLTHSRGASVNNAVETLRMFARSLQIFALVALSIVLTNPLSAASPDKSPKKEQPAKTVDLFAGMESGEITAVMIQKDSTEGTIMIATVCLDHGKPDPNPRLPYTPVPLASYAKDPAIAQLVGLMCAGQIDQHSAQAAAWHIQNGLSWEQLTNKIGIKHINGTTEPYFTPDQLQRAFAIARLSKDLAEKVARDNAASQ